MEIVDICCTDNEFLYFCDVVAHGVIVLILGDSKRVVYAHVVGSYALNNGRKKMLRLFCFVIGRV